MTPEPLSYAQLFFKVMNRDLKVAIHSKGDILNPLIFLIIVITLFPLGIGPETNLLTRIAPGIIWVAALLSALLSLERLFKNDFIDGSLEQMLLSPQPLFFMVLAKITAHWLLTGLPILIIAPLLGLMLHMEPLAYPALMITLAIGTPVLSLIGAIGVGLTVGLKKGGVLLSLLILPLYIPLLIFATGAIEAASLGMPYSSHIAIISALLIGSITLSPFAVSSALRVSTN